MSTAAVNAVLCCSSAEAAGCSIACYVGSSLSCFCPGLVVQLHQHCAGEFEVMERAVVCAVSVLGLITVCHYRRYI